MIPQSAHNAKKRTICLALLMLIVWVSSGLGQELDSAVEAAAMDTATLPASDAQDEPSMLTLPEALARAMRQSPVLAAYNWDIRAADAMTLQAGLRSNPELSVAIEEVRWTPGPTEKGTTTTLASALEVPFIGIIPAVSWERESAQGARSGLSESQITISIAHEIQLGRKRAKRVAAAERHKELVQWDYETARADVLAHTASDFVEVLAAQERVVLEGDLVSLAEEGARTFSLRVKAGQVSPLEQARAEVALVTAQIAHEESLTQLEAAKAALASNFGDKQATFGRAVGQLDEIQPMPELDELRERLILNPDIARWSAELAARQADFTLERAHRIPDLSVELGFRSTGLADRKATRYSFGTSGDLSVTRSETSHSDDRDNSLVLGFSMPLPVFDRNQGRIAAAEAMISKVSENRRAAEATVHAELTTAYEAAEGGRAKAQPLREEVMPKVNDTYRKIQQGYQQGKFSYLDVLDTQRTLFDAREAFLEALIQYHQGVVRMERITGDALAQTTGDSTDVETYNE